MIPPVIDDFPHGKSAAALFRVKTAAPSSFTSGLHRVHF
jgi:hypothetical protein